MEISNECVNSPGGILWQVRRSLRWINQADLSGVAYIQLIEHIQEPSGVVPEWYQRIVAEASDVEGLYTPRSKDSPAHITLFTRAVYFGIPTIYCWTPVLTLRLSFILAHEVAHHLYAERGYIFQPGERLDAVELREEFCNRYAFQVLKKMRDHWYYKLGAWATKELARWHFISGSSAWKDKKYQRAAERWEQAWNLDHERVDALYWSKRAREFSDKRQ